MQIWRVVTAMKLALTIALLFTAVIAVSQTSTSISGRVLNRDGSPAVNIRVMAVSAQDSSLQVGREIVSFAQTDATGNYRLEDVPTGRYFITAGIVEAPSYYPGVADSACATAVTLTAGSSLQGIDFLQVASQKISGKVIILPGSPPLKDGRGTQIRLMAANGLAQYAKIATDGTFEFPAIPRGDYDAMVNPGVVMVPVRVEVGDHDIRGVELSVPALKTIGGKVSVEGGGKISRIEFSTGRSSFATASAGINRLDGTSFSVTLPQGEFPISVLGTTPAGYSVKNFTFGNVDLLKESLNNRPDGTDQFRLVLSQN